MWSGPSVSRRTRERAHAARSGRGGGLACVGDHHRAQAAGVRTLLAEPAAGGADRARLQAVLLDRGHGFRHPFDDGALAVPLRALVLHAAVGEAVALLGAALATDVVDELLVDLPPVALIAVLV